MAHYMYNGRHGLQHVCGFYYIDAVAHTRASPHWSPPRRKYLPQISLSAHASIVSSTSRTTLTQTFVNPSSDKPIPELRYTFPLYDGAAVVGFVCTINQDRVITGHVKEKAHACQVYQAAIDRGETAGLLEQLPDASDVFTTTVGNVPPKAHIQVDITYLGELKHDAEVDGIRFTIPTSIAPRYGSYPGELLSAPAHATAAKAAGMTVVVDVEMPSGCNIKSVQSPSHPLAVTIGTTSTAAAAADMSLQRASATLSLGTAELDKDFIVQVVATGTGNPLAVLETHPAIPSQRALMATLVPKFKLPSSRPEIVFVCDRSGSMGSGEKIPNVKAALRLFLKSLPVGVKFNIVSFGSRHSFLFPNGSRTYDQASMDAAMRHVDTFAANYGGTEMHDPLEETFKKRYKDMDLEVFMLTDGEIWDQDRLFRMVNTHVADSNGAIRVFTLGVGADVSHALIEGLARAGAGFSQSVHESEKFNSKVVRMLKAALTPHVKDYRLEVKYDSTPTAAEPSMTPEDDFEVVEKVMDALTIGVSDGGLVTVAELPAEADAGTTQKPISLFDTSSTDPDVEMQEAADAKDPVNKYSHVPELDVPKLLQAPCEIPPLYPFNRTSVYLLLSPDTTQRTPKSVVLRGTCKHGPLELEIPITVLPDAASTVHQLAARKAVQELEEGGGWLHQAKDGSGELLKLKYESRFQDMVEREAVRLGVQYQVGGKWCSFVAVEANSAEQPATREEAKPVPEQLEGGLGNRLHQSRPAKKAKMVGRSGTALFTGAFTAGSETAAARPAPPPPPSGQQGMVGAQAFGSAVRSSMPASRSTSSSSFQPRLAGPQQTMQSMTMSPQMMQSAMMPAQAPGPVVERSRKRSDMSEERKARRTAALGMGAMVSPTPPGGYGTGAGAGDFATYQTLSTDTGAAEYPTIAPLRASSCYHSPTAALVEYGGDDVAFGFISDGDNEKAMHEGAKPKQRDPLAALIAAQTFEGFWRWADDLFATLGAGGDAITAAFDMLAGVRANPDAMATAVAVAFLRRKKASSVEEWEMLVEKAVDWLANLALGEPEDLVQAAEVLF